jgi:hypothetical protein
MIKGYVYRDITFILHFANYLRGSLLAVWFNYPIFGPLILVSVAVAEFSTGIADPDPLPLCQSPAKPHLC